MKIFTNDFLYQAASSVNCLPATRFFLEKMKVKIMNHEKCCFYVFLLILLLVKTIEIMVNDLDHFLSFFFSS